MITIRSILTLAATCFFLGSGIASADCVREGKVSRLTVTSGGNWVNVLDTQDFPGFATWFPVSSAYVPTLGAAFAANQKVKVTGNAASCGAVIGGFSSGGTVTAVDMFITH